MREYSYKTRKLKFAKGVQDDLSALNHQLQIINTEQITSIGEVEGKLTEVRKKISEIESKIQSGEIEPFQIEQYSDMLSDLRQKDRDYQNIVDTYNESSSGDYIGRMVSEVKARMSAQEKEKLRYLQEQKYEIYLPNDDNYAAFSELEQTPTIRNYTKAASGSWFDTEGENLAQKLENICNTHRNIVVGMVFKVGEEAYFVDTVGFKVLRDFDKTAIEEKREKSEVRKIHRR